MEDFTCLDRNMPAPGLGCLSTTISTFMDRMLFTVSIRVSPFLAEELAAEKLTTSAERRFSASSKESLVRVLFSKNILAIVTSLRVGTFLMERLITSLKLSSVSIMIVMYLLFRYLIPNK